MEPTDPAGRLERVESEVWVMLARSGDADAFRRLIDLYEPRLLYFLRRLLRDAESALDVLQEVWLTVFRRLAGVRSPAVFRTWLYQVAHDKAVDLIRRRRREGELLEAAAAAAAAAAAECGGDEAADGDEEAFDNAELVHRALEELSLTHREVLTLRFLEDMEVADIARVVRCSVGTAKSRLHYAKRAVRRKLEELSDVRRR